MSMYSMGKNSKSKFKENEEKQGQVKGILGTIEDLAENMDLEQELIKKNKILAQAQALAKVGSWELDIVHNRSYWSDETYRIYGIEREQYDMTFEGFLKFVHPEDVEIIENILENPSKEPFEIVFRIIHPDDSVRIIYQLVEIIFNEVGKPMFIYGTIQDITEKKELQKELEFKQEEIQKIQKQFQVLIQKSKDIFEILEKDGTIKFISEASEKILGYKPEERIGKKVYEFYEGEELQKLTSLMEFVLCDSGREIEENLIFKTNTGKNIHLEVHMQNLLDEPAVEGIVVNFSDITSRVEMEKKMAYISTHDELTGLPNSVYFKKQLMLQCQYAKETQTKFALMMLDLSGLKYVNYTLGYDLGNELIVEIVEKLKAFLGEDKFICRYSEDHFAVIVQGIRTNTEYKNIAKGIISLFSQSYTVKNYELSIDVNIGICIYHEDSNDMDSLKKQAKVALLRAKKEGKNTYKFYSPELNIQNYKECVMRSDLHHAIEKEQLCVYYQPIIDLKTNEIIATEALIRWNHPNWGLVSPNEFIPIAEETGLIVDIGKWVLSEVCKNYKEWLDSNLPSIKVAVNFSSIQFLEKDFVKNITRIIDEFGLKPNFLIIEITESVLVKNTKKAASDINSLQSLGVQLALDDFGTGYSSLSYLKSFNIDILKLDASFIKNIPLDGSSTAITSSVINLTKELKIKLVAEGIENWEQLSYLQRANCYLGQGYLYSKPVNIKDFETILVKKKCKPVFANDTLVTLREENRRKFFRIKFTQLLEADLTILEIRGKAVNVGNTKVLVKNIGPGGVCIISNIKFPIEKNIILELITELIEVNLRVYGYIVWGKEIENNLYEYGVEFTIDENEREDLVKVLNQVQIKMKNNILFSDGSFALEPPALFFKS